MFVEQEWSDSVRRGVGALDLSFLGHPTGIKVLSLQIPNDLPSGAEKSAAIAAIVLDLEVERFGVVEPIAHARRILLRKLGVADCTLERQVYLQLLASEVINRTAPDRAAA